MESQVESSTASSIRSLNRPPDADAGVHDEKIRDDTDSINHEEDEKSSIREGDVYEAGSGIYYADDTSIFDQPPPYRERPSQSNNASSVRVGGFSNPSSEIESSGDDRVRVLPGVFRRRRRLCIILALVVLTVPVVVVVAILVVRRNTSNAAVGDSSHKKGAITGGDGSTVTTEDGSTFIYHNPFGGFWVDDPDDPFNNDARSNSWTPPLNTSWKFGEDKINGVNLGGLFVIEPFVVPSFFEKYQNANDSTVVDEWTLSEALAADTSGGGLSQIEDHYNTFITEEDIAQMAGAGLNWIRLPVPFWAIDKWNTEFDQEPFLARTSWKYILRVFRWARKYGLRVNLDLHTAPGSQNGFNQSGKLGQVNFMNGVMGFANAQRMLGYIRILAEFISQSQYQNVVPMFGVMNEPMGVTIGQQQLSNFYLQAYDTIRGVTGIGEGKGPFISVHDGFEGISSWKDFLPGSDRINLDIHPYFAFGDSAVGMDEAPGLACNAWGPAINQSMSDFGMTIGGAFSLALNDCGLFVNGVNNGSKQGADCDYFDNVNQWNQSTKDQLKQFALAQMDALQNWFFWTWKVGNSSRTGDVQGPLWSYKLGLEQGYIPSDPRSANGVCASLNVTGTQFPGTFTSEWMTGGQGAGTIDTSARQSFSDWPPKTLNDSTSFTSGILDASLLPTYTSTRAMETLPVGTFFSNLPKTVSEGDGWANDGDTAKLATEVAGCSYPDAWSAVGVAVPTGACTAGQTFAAREAVVTQPPGLS